MPEHELVNPITIKNWNNLVLNTPGYSFFHTSNWAEVLEKTYDYTPSYFCKIGDNLGNLLPIMEVRSPITGTRGVCLPFTDFCEPISTDSNSFRKLFEQATAFGKKRKWQYLEIRGAEKHFSKQKPSEFFWEHTLDLNIEPKEIFSSFRDSTRRNIRKAQNENMNVSISNSLPSVKEFYRLNVQTRKEHGLPPQPYRFFQHLHERVISQNMGFVVSASIYDRVIAANVYLNFGNEVIYKYGASDKTYQHLRPNNLIMWEAIKCSCEKGFQKFCFGRTEPQNEGLMQFKAGWGAKLSKISYYRYDLLKAIFISNHQRINQLAKMTFSKLPGPALKMLGKILYRHMG